MEAARSDDPSSEPPDSEAAGMTSLSILMPVYNEADEISQLSARKWCNRGPGVVRVHR